MEKRTIIIGDVHGCYLELRQLLKKVEFDPGKDQLYFTGDIINRGPYSRKVFSLIHSLKAQVVLGNHELYLLLEEDSLIKPYTGRNKLKEEFGDLYPMLLENLREWPAYIETPDFLLVHGGIAPGIALDKTDPSILTNIRTWDGIGEDLKSSKNPPWFDFYQGSKLIVFGHWAALGGVVKDNVIGLDTGCVYGKKLSALVLPERKIVNIPALKEYFPI